MAKDDYHVIVYRILSYLYQCLKNGDEVDPKNLQPTTKYFQVNENYWRYIIKHLVEDGLIEGVVLAHIDGLKYPIPAQLQNAMITPKGIEYLSENSFMKKALEIIKDVKDITPFI